MKVKAFLAAAKAVATSNSPWIAVGVGIGLMGVAIVTAIKHTPGAKEAIEEKEEEKGEELTVAEAVQTAGKCYISTIVLFVLAVILILFAQREAMRKVAAYATAYSLSEAAQQRYIEATKETVGEQKEADIRACAAQKGVDDRQPTAKDLVVVGKQNMLCQDGYSGAYYWSNADRIKDNFKEITYLCSKGFTKVWELYYEQSIREAMDRPYAQVIGWPEGTKLEPVFSVCMGHGEYENIPILVVDFNVVPDKEPDAFGDLPRH